MAIDFSTNTSDWWKTSFERYFAPGGMNIIIESGGLEQHFKNCLPLEDFPDKEFQTTSTQWRITATHNGAGERFELVVDRVTKEWQFNWLG